ncbi:MAG: AbgT family transporter [Pyramidobacter sp.]|nr:AbgT family transporter [Pyramidobacter sp.]MBP3750991.1 AbgT family transporter [Pyramidobacter sp.]
MENTAKRSLFARLMKGIERVGNKLPHPFFLFTGMAVLVLIASVWLDGTQITYVSAGAAGKGAVETTATIKSLLTGDYIKKHMMGFVNTYKNFPPLGLIMVMMLSIGFAQDTGMFDAVLRKSLMSAPPFMVTFVLALVGVCANIASNAGIVFSATIGAALFASLGRNPILGLLTGYCATHGAWSANLMIAGTDVLLAGITESAAGGMSIKAASHPMINYYYMFAASFVVALIITFVTEKIMSKFVTIGEIDAQRELSKEITPDQARGLKWAGIAALAYLALILALTVPSNAFLRTDTGALLPSSPFVSSIVFILFFAFFFTGLAYGLGAKTIKSQKDIPALMSNGLRGSLVFFAVSLPAAYFVRFFADSKLAVLLSVRGGEFLKSMNLTGIPLAVMFVLLCAVLNLFMTGASEKWMVLAPIFVPMFATMGFSPALTQLCYRIGDSTTNPIAPVSYFIPIVLGIMAEYSKPEDREGIGVGTMLSMTLPYSLALLVGLILLLVVFMLLGLPIGPGTPLFL